MSETKILRFRQTKPRGWARHILGRMPEHAAIIDLEKIRQDRQDVPAPSQFLPSA